MTSVALVALVALAAGAVIARWWAVVAAAAAWSLFVVGLERGWWGSGVGDGWPWMLGVGAAVAGVSAAVGVSARRLLASTRVAPPSHRRVG